MSLQQSRLTGPVRGSATGVQLENGRWTVGEARPAAAQHACSQASQARDASGPPALSHPPYVCHMTVVDSKIISTPESFAAAQKRHFSYFPTGLTQGRGDTQGEDHPGEAWPRARS